MFVSAKPLQGKLKRETVQKAQHRRNGVQGK